MKLSHKLIVANWKSNKSVTEAKHWAETFVQQEPKDAYTYVVCPPYSALLALQDQEQYFALGVQDLSAFGAGAYTGEISAHNLLDLGVKYAILGHSERRRYQNETSADVAKKVTSALDAGITPIVCVDRDQFGEQAAQLTASQREQVIVAYEPVHAISTFGGQEDPIETTLENIAALKESFGNVPVLYGGSVTPENSLVYLQEDAIQGVLVGGTSLDPEKFAQL
ncbi:triose-phosphate isomerase [Candidatus Woesebacteria bacterium]|nr:triose-phosphate isomerase [Candidatus Woesebacteria bacterium]MCD8507159.1 triose-phosphate isomerase [Candidatus Woesebacteria bacterium]MCD8527050.1 triose-phosphate isomerase [Candidatus Woesebacteria bacterium]MCD8545948.1 triose-phosphate isomerase [Candidatus Woesebacteria bacterium]